MSEVTPWVIVSVFAGLLLGGFFTYGLFPNEVEVEVPVPQTCPAIEIPTAEECPICEPEEIEIEVANADKFIEQAKKDLFDEIGDDDEFLTCGEYEFDEEEVAISKIYQWSYTWLNDDEYEVTFDAKFKFDDDSDERACKETRTYKVFYEKGENPEVELIE